MGSGDLIIWDEQAPTLVMSLFDIIACNLQQDTPLLLVVELVLLQTIYVAL